MLSHICIGANDFERSFTFYSSLLPLLDLELKFKEPERPWAGWMKPGQARPLFVVGAPFDGQPAAPGNGQMVALLAPSRDSVDRFYAAAISNGARCEGPPGLRPEYHPNYYGAYFRDPEGNKLCVCCHNDEQTPD
jgi:catechol 2,3-dioxygenase-like lactoylglutathione lyase family enzyme